MHSPLFKCSLGYVYSIATSTWHSSGVLLSKCSFVKLFCYIGLTHTYGRDSFFIKRVFIVSVLISIAQLICLLHAAYCMHILMQLNFIVIMHRVLLNDHCHFTICFQGHRVTAFPAMPPAMLRVTALSCCMLPPHSLPVFQGNSSAQPYVTLAFAACFPECQLPLTSVAACFCRAAAHPCRGAGGCL